MAACVQGARTLICRPGGDLLDIVDEGLAFFDGAELQAPADMRSDIDISGGKLIAGHEGFGRHSLFERVHDSCKAAITDHPAFLRRYLEAKAPVGDRSLQGPAAKNIQR